MCKKSGIFDDGHKLAVGSRNSTPKSAVFSVRKGSNGMAIHYTDKKRKPRGAPQTRCAPIFLWVLFMTQFLSATVGLDPIIHFCRRYGGETLLEHPIIARFPAQLTTTSAATTTTTATTSTTSNVAVSVPVARWVPLREPWRPTTCGKSLRSERASWWRNQRRFHRERRRKWDTASTTFDMSLSCTNSCTDSLSSTLTFHLLSRPFTL